MKKRRLIWLAAVASLGVLLVATVVLGQQSKKTDFKDGEDVSFDVKLTRIKSSPDAKDLRPAVTIVKGKHSGRSFVVLENAVLEKLEKTVADDANVATAVEGTMTAYEGSNFLWLSWYEGMDEEEIKTDTEEEEKDSEGEMEEEEGESLEEGQ